jgi:tetratricopeptide (TPR) repeat protein
MPRHTGFRCAVLGGTAAAAIAVVAIGALAPAPAAAAAKKKGAASAKPGTAKPAAARPATAKTASAAPATSAPATAAAATVAAATADTPSAAARPDADRLTAEEKARLHFRAGRAFMDLGRFADAEDEFSAGHALAPRPAFLYNLGQALWYEGKLGPALERLEAALAFKSPPPDAALAKLIRDDIHRLEIEAKGGAKSPRPAPPADPVALAKIHYDLAGANFELGLFSEAMASFRAGYKLYARPGFLLNMATCLEVLGDYSEAIRHAEGYIAHAGAADPNVSLARELIARSHKALAEHKSGPIESVLTAPAPAAPPSHTALWVGAGAGAVLLAGGVTVLLVFLLKPGAPDWLIEDYGPLTP